MLYFSDYRFTGFLFVWKIFLWFYASFKIDNIDPAFFKGAAPVLCLIKFIHATISFIKYYYYYYNLLSIKPIKRSCCVTLKWRASHFAKFRTHQHISINSFSFSPFHLFLYILQNTKITLPSTLLWYLFQHMVGHTFKFLLPL